MQETTIDEFSKTLKILRKRLKIARKQLKKYSDTAFKQWLFKKKVDALIEEIADLKTCINSVKEIYDSSRPKSGWEVSAVTKKGTPRKKPVYICTECGELSTKMTDYCPHCGLYMKGGH